MEIITKVIKMIRWKTWVQRPSDLIKNGGKHDTFNGCYLVKVEKVA
jgi:hypothetical protein